MNSKSSILVFINDSLGELDWIAPFIRSSYGKKYTFFIYLYLPGVTNEYRKQIFNSYFAGSENDIIFLNEEFEISSLLSTFDRYINSLLRRVSGFSRFLFVTLRYLFDSLRFLYASVTPSKYHHSFDFIMRDYNLKDSFGLSVLIKNSNDAKVVVFPHSTAIQSNTINTPKNHPKRISCDLFLENTDLSNLFSDSYQDVFLSVGSPSFDELSKRCNKSDEYMLKSFIFITRNCDPRFFGLCYDDCGVIFESAIKWAYKNNYTIYVKHHPRDPKLGFWRDIQSNYDCVVEITESLNKFSEPLAFALCFYTSAGLLFTIRKIPVYDVSPYSGNPANLPFHFYNSHGVITHELVQYGIYQQSSDVVGLLNTLHPDKVQKDGLLQYNSTVKYFPSESCLNIDNALSKLVSR